VNRALGVAHTVDYNQVGRRRVADLVAVLGAVLGAVLVAAVLICLRKSSGRGGEAEKEELVAQRGAQGRYSPISKNYS
jgi:hypothetical protein